MSDTITGYLTTKQAAKLTGYTKDYVGQLARMGHIDSKKVGRARMVKTNDLFAYVQAKEEQFSAVDEKVVKIEKVEQVDTYSVETTDDNSTITDPDVVSKKIISPWVAPITAETSVPEVQLSNVEFSIKPYNTVTTETAVAKRSPILPMISASAMSLAVLVLMFTLGTVMVDRAKLSNTIAGSSISASVGNTNVLDKVAIKWFELVAEKIR